MKKTDRYLKIVEWSRKDGCYVGTCPGLILGGIHGRNQAKVFSELCEAVEEAVRLLESEGRPLPPATAGKRYSGKIMIRIPPELHKKLAIQALKEGESINRLVQHRLGKAA